MCATHQTEKLAVKYCSFSHWFFKLTDKWKWTFFWREIKTLGLIFKGKRHKKINIKKNKKCTFQKQNKKSKPGEKNKQTNKKQVIKKDKKRQQQNLPATIITKKLVSLVKTACHKSGLFFLLLLSDNHNVAAARSHLKLQIIISLSEGRQPRHRMAVTNS